MAVGRPKAVLFDVGNVIVRWDPRTLYSKIFSDPVERDIFLAEVCSPAWHVEHDRGAAWDETIPALVAKHPRYAVAIRAWKDRWWEMFSGTIPETEAVIVDLNDRGVPLYALTNMAAEVYPGVRAMSPVLALFRDIVVSGVEKVIKPQARFFEIACARAKLTPQDFVFVDDSADNIQAAKALGFHVHLFQNPAALRPDLEAFGLL